MFGSILGLLDLDVATFVYRRIGLSSIWRGVGTVEADYLGKPGVIRARPAHNSSQYELSSACYRLGMDQWTSEPWYAMQRA
jgi:hypothetical protein